MFDKADRQGRGDKSRDRRLPDAVPDSPAESPSPTSPFSSLPGGSCRPSSGPVSELAELLTGLDLDLESLSDVELVSRLDLLERAKAACAAAQARLTSRFVDLQATQAQRLRASARACADAGDFEGWVVARDRARALELAPATPDDRGSGSAGRRGRGSRSARHALGRNGVAAQVGLARRESPSRGACLANLSMALVHDLPHTLTALTIGAINERRAELVARGTSHLDPALRSVVDSEIVGAHLDPMDPSAGIGSWGDRELERRIRACADRLDAHGAVERARTAVGQRRVTIRPIPDTMAIVSAVLPVAQAVAVHAVLTRTALSGKAAGDERGKGQLMADTLVERVTGQARADEVPLEVQVVLTDRALIDGADTPAHIPGYGPVPAGWARDLLTRSLAPVAPVAPVALVAPVEPVEAVAQAAAVWFRRLYIHPGTGSLVAMDSARRLFPAGLRRFVVARDGQCRTPWCDAPVAHIDHVRPHAEGGPTSAANGQGLCVRCNLVKQEPGWSATVIHPGPGSGSSRPHTVRTRTPTGHTYRSVAPPLLPGLAERPPRTRRSARSPATAAERVRRALTAALAG